MFSFISRVSFEIQFAIHPITVTLSLIMALDVSIAWFRHPNLIEMTKITGISSFLTKSDIFSFELIGTSQPPTPSIICMSALYLLSLFNS